MGKIVLLAVAAAWAAVLLPPLLRSRLENRPGSSVTDFRRQLSTLQRTVPTRSITPMRSMARPLAPSPAQRQAVRPASSRAHGANLGPSHLSYDRGEAPARYERTHGEPAYTGELQRRYDREHRYEREHRDLRDRGDLRDPRAEREHRYEREYRYDREPARPTRQAPVYRSQRDAVRRRRANVLFVLVMATAVTLFLAATVKTSTMVYAFALAFVSLCGYCYKLAQLRQYEQDRTSADSHWYHAA